MPRRDLDSAEWWTTAICNRYFNSAFAGEPVMLSVDQDELNSIAGTGGTNGIDALAKVVRAQVMPGHRFGSVYELMEDWKSGTSDVADSPPPCIPLLAVNVLAASQMDNNGRPGAPSFYRPLRRLLDPADDNDGMPPTYSDFVPQFWEELKSWLANNQSNQRGIPTIERHSHEVNVGYAKQQSLVRVADRRLIYRFFHAMRFEPGEANDVSVSELRRTLGYWAPTKSAAGQRLHRLATDSSVERYAESLLSILLRRWDGRLPDLASGAPTLPIKLFIPSEVRGAPMLQMVAVDNRSELSGTALVTMPDGSQLTLERSSSGVMRPDPLPIAVDDHTLSGGLDISGDTIGLFFNQSAAFLFRRSDGALSPDWVSTRQIRFGEEHLLLIRKSDHQKIKKWIASEPSASGEIEPKATRLLPGGWFLYRRFRLDTRPAHAPPPAIADLLSSSGGSFTKLVGGLRLKGLKSVYLEGGSPLLALAKDSDPNFVIHHEGFDPVARTASDGEFQLAELPIPTGHVLIEHEGREITFDLESGLSDMPNAGVGTTLSSVPLGRAASGLLVSGPGPKPPQAVRVPSAEPGVVLGPAAGDVALAQLPKWLENELGWEPSYKALDLWHHFSATWFLKHAATDGYIAYPLASIPPEQSSPDSQWARIIQRASLHPSADDDTVQLWKQYRDMAT